MREPKAFRRTVAAVALLKVGLGILATLVSLALHLSGLTPRYYLIFAHVVIYGAVGVILLRSERRDERAGLLGLVFLLTATAYADRMIGPLRAIDSPFVFVLQCVFALQVDAFIAYYIWRFVQEFPRQLELSSAGRAIAIVTQVALATGALLFGINLVWFILSQSSATSAGGTALYALSRVNDRGVYWPTLFALALPALPVLFLRARTAPREERRRALLLTAGLVLGTGPSILWLLATSMSPWAAANIPLRKAGWVLYPMFLSTPLTTTYAVLVRRALNVTLVVRRAMQYALARYSTIGLAAIPIVLLAFALYNRRTESVAHIASSAPVLGLSSVALLGIGVVRGRRGALERLDRRFFREQYDARRILGELVDRCRRAGSRTELERVLRTEIDRALHPERVDLLLLTPDGRRFDSRLGTVRPLDRASPLVETIARREEPLEVRLEDSSGNELTQSERYWLADAGAALVVPLKDADHRVIGLIVLGDKKSELPYSREDKQLLAGVAAAAELAIGYYRLEPESHPTVLASTDTDIQLATECVSCGLVAPTGTRRCTRCGEATEDCLLPQTIAGKFHLEERIGEGGMGVVYRALDVHLDRSVAIKTLPQVAPDRGLRLRREARAMALVSHPHLAHIYGAETLHGRPMLVVEYLPGGTLAQRLRAGTLEVRTTLELAEALTGALAALHRASVLHRDVKPTNIAFAADGAAKLLDFGVARILGETRHTTVPTDASWNTADTFTEAGVIVGTPFYMSPEARNGEPADARFDLWSMALVMYESLVGHYALATALEPNLRDREGRVPVSDIRELAPEVPRPVADFLANALSPDVHRRPASAAAFARIVRELRAA